MASRDLLIARLRWLLKRDDLTPARFARKLGRSRAWASDVLSGKSGTTLATLDEIAAFFRVEPVTFLQPVVHGTTDEGSDLGRLSAAQQSTPTGKGGPHDAPEEAETTTRLLAAEERITEVERQLAATRVVTKTAARQIAKRLAADREAETPPPAPTRPRGGHRKPRR